jgi:hypothetical protein
MRQSSSGELMLPVISTDSTATTAGGALPDSVPLMEFLSSLDEELSPSHNRKSPSKNGVPTLNGSGQRNTGSALSASSNLQYMAPLTAPPNSAQLVSLQQSQPMNMSQMVSDLPPLWPNQDSSSLMTSLILSQPDPSTSLTSSAGQPEWKYLDSYYKHYYPYLSIIPKDYFYQWVPVESNFLLDAMYALGARELGDLSASLMYFERSKQGVFDIMLHPSLSSIHGLYLIAVYALCEFCARDF